jgi:hypothetical protein
VESQFRFDSADACYPAADTRRGGLGQRTAFITWWGRVDPYRRAGTSPSFTVDLDLHWLQAGRGQQDPTARPTTPELASPGKELKTVPCSASRCSPSTLKDPYVSSTCARSSDRRPSLGWAANVSTPTMTEDRSSRADCRWRWESQPRHPATELFHTPGQRTLGAMTAGRLALRRWRDLAQPDFPCGSVLLPRVRWNA